MPPAADVQAVTTTMLDLRHLLNECDQQTITTVMNIVGLNVDNGDEVNY